MRIHLLLCALLTSPLHAEEIPLKSVWAFRMPGTSPMSDVVRGDGSIPQEAMLLNEIRRRLLFDPSLDKAEPMFAVVGTGMEALREAHRVIVSEEAPRDSFSPTDTLTLVFFSYDFGSFVGVHRVQVNGNDIDVHFDFTLHDSAMTTQHIALIPLGKLKPGQYQVSTKYVSRDISKAAPERGLSKFVKTIVATPFAFSVKSTPGEH